MGSDFVARSRALQQVIDQDQDQQEHAAMVEEVKNKILKVAVTGIHAAPPTHQPDNALVANLPAYYRDEFWVGPGTVLEDDYNPQGVPAWRHHLDVAGSGDDDRQVKTIDVNWLMKFTAPESRFYHFFPTTAEFGSIWVFSDGGFNPDAHAHIRMSVKANVSPGGVPGSSISAGRLNVDKDRVNEVHDIGRPGGYPDDQLHVTEYVPQGETVTVMFTHEFYLYARGFGAVVHVYFDSDSQGLGPVWCYVFLVRSGDDRGTDRAAPRSCSPPALRQESPPASPPMPAHSPGSGRAAPVPRRSKRCTRSASGSRWSTLRPLLRIGRKRRHHRTCLRRLTRR
jgi:hypothetical protein